MAKKGGESSKGAEVPERVKARIAEKEGRGVLDKLKASLSKLSPIPSRREVAPRIRERFGTESLTASVQGRPLDEYPIGQAQVFIYRKGGTGHYVVSEPSLSEGELKVYRDLLRDFYFSLEPESGEDIAEHLEGAIWESAYELGFLDEVRRSFSKYRYFLKRDALGFGKLHVPMNDPEVEEISIASPGDPVRVLHRKYTELGWLETNIRFRSEMELRNYNERIAQRLGKSLTAAAPMVDATTKEGDRVSLTFGDEVTHPGSSFTIRKHRREPLSLAYLVNNGTLSPLIGAYLWQILEWRGFVEVVGPIGGGKTTLLNAILSSVDPNAKRDTIEDTLELKLPPENWQTFHTRTGHFAMGEEYEVDLFDLTKTVMRHRPDYIAVGEVRGEEIKTLTHAVSLGHSAASTLHAESPEKAIQRMRTPPMDLSEGEILLIWAFALTNRVTRPSGKIVRRVSTVKELNPDEESRPQLREMFEYDRKSDSFAPGSADEVADKSERLRTAADLWGASQRELVERLEEKAELLEKMVERGELGFDGYVERVREYYS